MTRGLKGDDNGPDIIQRIRDNGDEAIREIYRTYYLRVTQWLIRTFKVDEATAVDIFHDTLVALYDNVMTGKLTELHVKLITYLISIAKHLVIKHKRKYGRITLSDDWERLQASDLNLDIPYLNEESEISLKLQKAIKKLGEGCRKVIHFLFYRGFSHESIAERMGYKSEGVSRQKRKNCIKKLRAILESQTLKGV